MHIRIDVGMKRNIKGQGIKKAFQKLDKDRGIYPREGPCIGCKEFDCTLFAFLEQPGEHYLEGIVDDVEGC